MPLVRLVCPHWTTVPLSRRAVALAICLLLGTWSVMGESVQQPTLANGSSGGSLALPKSSLAGKPFSIQQQGEGAWLVRPNGERFFSFGVCVVNMGASRKEFDASNPGYAAWQRYADSNHWAEA